MLVDQPIILILRERKSCMGPYQMCMLVKATTFGLKVAINNFSFLMFLTLITSYSQITSIKSSIHLRNSAIQLFKKLSVIGESKHSLYHRNLTTDSEFSRHCSPAMTSVCWPSLMEWAASVSSIRECTHCQLHCLSNCLSVHLFMRLFYEFKIN